MFGAALATGIAPVVSIAVLLPHLLKKDCALRPCRLRPEVRAFRRIASLGVFSFITEVSSGVVMLVFNFIMLRLGGNLAVAAYGIVANIALVVLSVFTGVAQGVQPVVSAACGEGDTGRVKRVWRYGLLVSLLFSAAVFAAALGSTEPSTAAFNRDGLPALTALAARGLRLYSISFFFAGVSIVTAACCAATAAVRPAFVISLLRGTVLLIPAVLLLSAWLGTDGVWLSLTAAISLLFARQVLRRATA